MPQLARTWPPVSCCCGSPLTPSCGVCLVGTGGAGAHGAPCWDHWDGSRALSAHRNCCEAIAALPLRAGLVGKGNGSWGAAWQTPPLPNPQVGSWRQPGMSLRARVPPGSWAPAGASLSWPAPGGAELLPHQLRSPGAQQRAVKGSEGRGREPQVSQEGRSQHWSPVNRTGPGCQLI